ncbi:uncharacterized protein LOC106170955 [Lingula anatina]|uniref:Uncharacterized protein LOC106170955 n=1 Tax=Lingula anatina TaxID=7574 RepID=A0A1S3J839_LINAN|nr:uncharacterized protein LOC106170955 [Lingula anatina]|eukprot:XP_013406478.1 uncharacterized protein LOC106170955 [Lingula anatina]
MATAIAEMPAAPYPEIDQFKLTPNTTYQQQYCGENISGMGAIDYEGRKQALKGKIREMILQIRQPKKPYKMHRGPWEEMPVSEEARRIQGEREAQGQTGLTDSKDIREVDKRSKDAMIKKAEDQVRLAVKQYMDSINYKQQKDSAKNMGKKTPTQGGKDNTVQGRTDLMITSTAMKPQPKPGKI